MGTPPGFGVVGKTIASPHRIAGGHRGPVRTHVRHGDYLKTVKFDPRAVYMAFWGIELFDHSA